MNTSQIGNIGEARVLTEFMKYNIQCYIPYGDGCVCDLIAEFNGKLNKIQIKTYTISIRIDENHAKIKNPNIRYSSDYQISKIVGYNHMFS